MLSRSIKVARDYIALWRRSFSLVWGLVPKEVTIWTALLLIQGLIPAATVYFTKITIETFSATMRGGGKYEDIVTSLSWLVLTGSTMLLTELVQSGISFVGAKQADAMSDHLKALIHKKAFEVDYAFYESPSYYDLLEQARNESLSKPIELVQNSGVIFQAIITVISFSTILLNYSWWIPLVLFLGAIPSLLIFYFFDRQYHRWTESTAASRRLLMYYETMICHSKSAAEIRLFKLNNRFLTLFQTLRLRLRSERLRYLGRQQVGKFGAQFVSISIAGGAFIWMSIRVLSGLASLGDLALFYQIFTRGQSIVQSLFNGFSRVINSTLYLKSLFEFLDIEPKIIAPSNPVPFPVPIMRGIEFKNVEFRYPGAENSALSDFSLFLPAGKITAIVGANGAGKSTLIKLLCRFYDPPKGAIKIDGIDIREFDVDELRRNLSLHFQEPMQYQETVSENIAFGDVDSENVEGGVLEASALAGADLFIEKLPQKYDTLLGKWFVDGCELSGGQWQRIALARAYYRKAPILILDEPTSFMDSWAEVEWFNSLRALLDGKTGFIITHRFTIAMRADVINVMNDGKLVESGTHSELLQQKGFYCESWRAQMQIVESEGSRQADGGGY